MKSKHLTFFIIVALTFLSCKNDIKDAKKEIEIAVDSLKTEEVINEIKKVSYIYGVDISSYQGNDVNFINKNRDSLSFAICKATQGITYTDSNFRKNWSKIKSDGFIRGTYHFYMANDNPGAQANHFANTISTIEDSDLPPIIDFESASIDSHKSVNDLQNDLIKFMIILESKLNRKPIISTDTPTANKYLNDPRFSEYALWIVDYNGKNEPGLPGTWENTGWTFWQRDANNKIANITDDSDVFNGDISQLKDFIKNYK